MQCLQNRTVWGDISAICISVSVSQTTWQCEQQSHPSARAALEAFPLQVSWMASETRAHCPFQRTGHWAAGDTLNNSEPTSCAPWRWRPLCHMNLAWSEDSEKLGECCSSSLPYGFIHFRRTGPVLRLNLKVRLFSTHIIYIQVSFTKELEKHGENRLLCPMCSRQSS